MLPLDDRTIELFFTRYRDRSPHPDQPPVRLLPPDVPAARPRSRRRSGDGAGTCRPPSSARRGRAGSSTPRAPRTPGSACSSRTTGWSSTTTASATTTWWCPTAACPVGASGGGRAVPPHRDGRRGHPGHRRRRPAATLTVPFAMTMISSVGPSVGYDHGSPVSERYAGHFPFEGDARPAGRRPWSASRRRPDGAEAAERARRHGPPVSRPGVEPGPSDRSAR